MTKLREMDDEAIFCLDERNLEWDGMSRPPATG